jgi:hypothetical protein
VTISDAFPVDAAAAVPAAAPVSFKQEARPHVRMRTRSTSVPRVTAAAKVMWSDLRESWWLPESVPTVVEAWQTRWPDRDTVPGNSEVLYTAWSVYNHTLALPAVAVLNLLVGVLTPLVFVLRHPARLALALLVVVPIVVAVAAA